MRQAATVGVCILVAATIFPVQSQQSKATGAREYPAPMIREEQEVVIDGFIETWRLVWLKPPKPACSDPVDGMTCPCAGFAYGEAAELALVRQRSGREIDRLDLTASFKGEYGGLPLLRSRRLDDADNKLVLDG